MIAMTDIPKHLQDKGIDVACDLPTHEDWYPEHTEAIVLALHEVTAPLVEALRQAEMILSLLHRDGAHVDGKTLDRLGVVRRCRAALRPYCRGTGN